MAKPPGRKPGYRREDTGKPARLNPAHDFYIYALYDGACCLYVGKGSGRRVNKQRARFGVDGQILERFADEAKAYAAEIRWIEKLKPIENRNAGGRGSWRQKGDPETRRFEIELNTTGPRRYVARFLKRKLNYENCEKYNVSKTDMNRILEVANGPYC